MGFRQYSTVDLVDFMTKETYQYIVAKQVPWYENWKKH